MSHPQEPRRRVRYMPRDPGAEIECVALSDVRDRVGSQIHHLEQIEMHLVIACTEGSGFHEVDFERTVVNPRRWVHVRPQQVHRWIGTDFEALLILLPEVDRAPLEPRGSRVIDLSPGERADLAPLLDLLSQPRAAPLRSGTDRALRDLVVRWLDLDQPDDSSPLYAAFMRLLAQAPVGPRSVGYYARQLNCSTKTLARACASAGAPTPKKLIDHEVLLRARRMLALPASSVSQASDALGFDEVTNFTKFFKRLTGVTPSQFQISMTTGSTP